MFIRALGLRSAGLRRVMLASAAAASGLVLAACGSHQSAPIVYGSGDGHTGRIYNSPEEIYAKQRLERAQLERVQAAQRPAASYAAAGARDFETVSLKPVAEAGSDGRPEAQARRPAKGYIEVQRGDTVYALSQRFDVAPKEIIEANDLAAPYTLRVGQALKLPRGASVVEAPAATRRVVARDTLYTVRKGDTLYSISRASKVSVDAIASANRLRAPYAIDVGQQLVIPQAHIGDAPRTRTAAAPAPRPASAAKPASSAAAPASVSELTRQVSYAAPSSSSAFEWPLRGAIVSEFGMGELGRRNDGINIAAPAGAPVRAAAAGEVVYRGSELDGFGNLLLIKHDGGYVTAYAHNDAMLVRKGDRVRQGQVIAKVGQTGDVKTPQLHFEIRRELKAVDPTSLLGTQ